MNPRRNPQPFGTIQYDDHTASFIASADWEGISTSWNIRMYPTQVENNETVEMPSVSNVAEELWPTEWKIIK